VDRGLSRGTADCALAGYRGPRTAQSTAQTTRTPGGPGDTSYWRYCLQCHLAAWPYDRRCQNGNSAPGSRTYPRPQTFLGNGWQLVAGDLWLTDFPEKRSQKAHSEPLAATKPAARTLPANPWWWLAPPAASRGRSRSGSPVCRKPSPSSPPQRSCLRLRSASRPAPEHRVSWTDSGVFCPEPAPQRSPVAATDAAGAMGQRGCNQPASRSQARPNQARPASQPVRWCVTCALPVRY